jgi:hypothetical protein
MEKKSLRRQKHSMIEVVEPEEEEEQQEQEQHEQDVS